MGKTPQMFITNYQDPSPECQSLSRLCGTMAESILGGSVTKELGDGLRQRLMELSRKTGSTIELLTVKGEVWLNIRSGSQKSISLDGIKKMIALHKQYQIPPNESGEAQVPISDLRQNLQNRWNWLR